MKKYQIIGLFVICILVFIIPANAFAKSNKYTPVFDDQIIFGGTYTLYEGEVLDGNIIVIGGVVTLEKESLVKGDVITIGSSVNIAGDVTQSVVAVGGVLYLEETTIIRGDLIAPGSVMNRSEGAQVFGQIIANAGPINIEVPGEHEIPEIAELPDIPDTSQIENKVTFSDKLSGVLGLMVEGLWTMFRAFAVSAVAVVLILFLPEQATRTSNTIFSHPIVSGLIGLLTIVIAGPLMALLAITIILIPVTIIMAIALSLGLFFGWIVIGQEIGRRIEAVLGQEWSEPIQAGVGTLLLTILFSLINVLFWDILGWMFGTLVAAVGLGAVLLTRFGTRDYVESQVTQKISVVSQKEDFHIPDDTEEMVNKNEEVAEKETAKIEKRSPTQNPKKISSSKTGRKKKDK